MASSSHPTLFFSLILFSLLFLSPSHAETSLHPHALLLTVHKDPSTHLYTIQLNQTKHQLPKNLTLDLGGKLLWEYCTEAYAEATQKHARCSKNSCEVRPENTVTGVSTKGTLALGTDVVSIQSTDGSNPGSNVSAPRFFFVCAPSDLLKGLPSYVKGMAGLGRTQTSLPSQFSSRFKFNNTFAICLSAPPVTGVVIFGHGPYRSLRNSQSPELTYTPLLNPASTVASDYFIGVKSIQINGKTVPGIDASLLAMDGDGNRGTKLSTVTPYTVLQTSIYNAVIKFFQSELSELGVLPGLDVPVAPFGLCFHSQTSFTVSYQYVAPEEPIFELVLQNEGASWKILEGNLWKQVGSDVYCLAFVDGGMNPKTSIGIGGHQLEQNLLQFHLGASMLGFSSTTVLRSKTTCEFFV